MIHAVQRTCPYSIEMFVIFPLALDICELASVPINSGLQGDVLTGDSWG